jgi:hypothetical protein
MLEILSLAVVVLFFLSCYGFLALCQRLMRE